MLMLDVDLTEERQNEILTRARALVEKDGGVWVGQESWGRRKLAYEIDKKTDGIYYLLNFDCEPATLDELTVDNRIVARYVGGNPNGSMRDIAGIRNEAGNVVGIMPHPEHAVEELTGPSLDGLGFFASVLKHLAGAGVGAGR